MNKTAIQTKILVVDDYLPVLEELGEFLTNKGYLCILCSSSLQAIECFREDEQINLVLFDLDIPDMSGLQLITQLQFIAGTSRTFEAIMLTGRADKQDVVTALRSGVADYYQKPLDLTEMLEGIHRLEVALHERQKCRDLSHLNQQLQRISQSINKLYEDLNLSRRPAESRTARDDDTESIPEVFTSLSPRQLGVAQLVSRGLTNYQIACDLGISENTVKLYVSQVLRLTHMQNRTQLALALSPACQLTSR